MFTKIKEIFSSFWKRHICDTFPYGYDQECFMCNKQSCVGCPLLYRNKHSIKEKECEI